MKATANYQDKTPAFKGWPSFYFVKGNLPLLTNYENSGSFYMFLA